jgi:hypothetical protein
MQAMLRSSRTRLSALVVSLALAVGMTAVPAASAQQQGLVNVDVHNVLNNNDVSVAIPINAAANICGVDVNVLSQMLANGPVTCTAGANQQFVVSQ